MRFTFTYVIFVAVVFALVGCTSGARQAVQVDYDGGRNVTTYEADEISISLGGTSNYAGGQRRIRLRAWARCPGQQCRPSKVIFHFSTGGGRSPLYVADRTVVFEAGPNRYEWGGTWNQEANRSTRIVGNIVDINVTPKQLVQIAQAESVQGRLGSNTFRLSYGAREPLRKLAQQISGEGSS